VETSGHDSAAGSLNPKIRVCGNYVITLREEQVEVFQKRKQREFREKMILHLRKGFVSQTAEKTDDDLRILIDSGIKRAKRYRVVLEDDVQRYLECMLFCGEDFDSHPNFKWARVALRARNLTGTEKMDVIEKRRRRGD
jgi:hypothetical protein